MCGFVCLLSSKIQPNGFIRALQKGSDALKYRGPDASGIWTDDRSFVGMAHRRLAVLDINSRSNQPFFSKCGRFAIVFNGEIYNYKNVQKMLETRGVTFHTNSDTEVLLELYLHFKEEMFEYLRGMYSFAIWDSTIDSIFIARDPYGIKPLYVAHGPFGWCIGSQVKSILAMDLLPPKRNMKSEFAFWLYGNIPDPDTCFDNISSLPAGSWATLRHDSSGLNSKKFFDIATVWKADSPCEFSGEIVSDAIRASIIDSVTCHLISDVPVGIFLSGGIDSGVLAALVSQLGMKNVHAITVAFDEYSGNSKDESNRAALLANRYGLIHHIRYVSRAEFEQDLPKIFFSMDQPSIDGINIWYASKSASELGLKVVLSGVGADELFYGYPTFDLVPKILKLNKLVARMPFSRSIENIWVSLLSKYVSNRKLPYLFDSKTDIRRAYLLKRSFIYFEELKYHANIATDVGDFGDIVDTLIDYLPGDLPDDSTQAVGLLEFVSYLRNQLLRDSDWASMYHGLELRTPFVDVDLLRGLGPYIPCFQKYKAKQLLAAVPSLNLQHNIASHKKTGFNIPISTWLREIYGDQAILPGKNSTELTFWAHLLHNNIY